MKAKMITILILSLGLVHCSKKSDPAPADASTVGVVDPNAPVVNIPGVGPYVPPGTGPGLNPGDNFYYGGTTNFAFDSGAAYREYTQRPGVTLDQLSNIRINLNFQKFLNNSYGGTVTIRYSLNGQLYEGFFTSGHEVQSNKYNVWFNKFGQKAWHGFFEDYMGAIVVVVDGVSQLNDGVQSTDTVSGSVWFKNFRADAVYRPHPQTYCWFVAGGPYDCRAWTVGHGVDTDADVYPGSGYIRLGTFTNMPATAAFEELSL